MPRDACCSGYGARSHTAQGWPTRHFLEPRLGADFFHLQIIMIRLIYCRPNTFLGCQAPTPLSMAEPKVWTGCENLGRKWHAIGVACSKHRQAPAEETAVGKEPIEECQYPDVTWRMVQGCRQAPNQKSVDIVSPWLSTRCCQWFSKFSIILSAVFQQRFSFVVHQYFSVVFHQKFSTRVCPWVSAQNNVA